MNRFLLNVLSVFAAFAFCLWSVGVNYSASLKARTASDRVSSVIQRVNAGRAAVLEAELEVLDVMTKLHHGEGSFFLLQNALQKRYRTAYSIDHRVFYDRFKELVGTLDSVALVRLLEQEPSFFEYIPPSSRTPAVVLAAKRYAWLSQVPTASIDADMAEVYVRAYPPNLQYVPREIMTSAIATMAVQADAKMLEYVPEALQTKQLCEMAVAKNATSLCDCRFDLRSLELSRTALQSSNDAESCVPKKYFLVRLP